MIYNFLLTFFFLFKTFSEIKDLGASGSGMTPKFQGVTEFCDVRRMLSQLYDTTNKILVLAKAQMSVKILN